MMCRDWMKLKANMYVKIATRIRINGQCMLYYARNRMCRQQDFT